MARLSFIEQERIARNMTDGDILGEYEQKGSVLPPGIELEPSVLLGEMNGRTYVRDATEAAQTAANMPPGSTADQQVEKFRQGREGIQNLLAQGGPQGGGMPPQGGMPSEAAMQAMGGMPPEGVQMAASGGVIGLQTGSPPTIPMMPGVNPYMSIEDFAKQINYQNPQESRPRLFDPSSWEGEGIYKEIPYLSGVASLLTGSRSFGEARDNPLRTASMMALMAGTGGYGALAKGAKGLYGLRTGANLANMGGRSLALAQQPGWRGFLGKRLLGGRATGYDPARATVDAAGRITGSGFIPATELGRTALLRGGGTTAGLAGLLMAPGEDLPDDALNALYAEYIRQQQGGGGGPGGGGGDGGFGGAYASDLAKIHAGRQSRLTGYEQWLRKRTPEEEALDDMMEARKTDILGRIDPERDRGDLLTELLGGSARAIDRQSRGGSAAETLADTASAIRAMGGQQRARNEMLDDTAFALGIMPAEGAVRRSRMSVDPERIAVEGELQQQIASLEGIDRNAQAQLQSQLLAIRAANEFGVGDIGDIENLMARMQQMGVPEEQIQQLMINFQRTIQNRMAGEAAGRQMGGTNNPQGQFSWIKN